MSHPERPPRILITVATYNEAENLPALADEVLKVVPTAHLLVIDDNSPDGTGRWCDARAEADPRVHCRHREGKLGLGTAIVAGMQYALEQDYDYVLNMDADFSHHPRYLPALIAGMDPPHGPAADVMIGSRYVTGGGTKDWPLKLKLMSRSVNVYARWMLSCATRLQQRATSMLSRRTPQEGRSFRRLMQITNIPTR